MSGYKKVKFWFKAGEEDLRQTVCDILVSQGAYLHTNMAAQKATGSSRGIAVKAYGEISAACDEKDEYWYSDLANYEEINIDWMRSQKPETIELNGKTYIKSELEEAISKIKPIGE